MRLRVYINEIWFACLCDTYLGRKSHLRCCFFMWNISCAMTTMLVDRMEAPLAPPPPPPHGRAGRRRPPPPGARRISYNDNPTNTL